MIEDKPLEKIWDFDKSNPVPPRYWLRITTHYVLGVGQILISAFYSVPVEEFDRSFTTSSNCSPLAKIIFTLLFRSQVKIWFISWTSFCFFFYSSFIWSLIITICQPGWRPLQLLNAPSLAALPRQPVSRVFTAIIDLYFNWEVWQNT